MQRAFGLALLIGNAIGLVISVWAVLMGPTNALGWIIVALYLIFAIGFAQFMSPRARAV
ncbi:MAG: hypothetical protein ACYCYF_02805 [Anaerolineae bacterium]